MKKLLLPVFVAVTITCSGQISLSLSDMIQVGDTVTRFADTMTTLTPGPAGSNQNWVMTTAATHLTLVTKAMTPSSTPYGSSYTSSNIAMTNDNLSYLYGDQNNSVSILKGAKGDLLLTGCTLNTPFNPDMLLHNFPRTYSSNFSDAYGIDVTTTGSCVNQPVDQVRYKRESMVYDTADGWGVITTPVGKYQCLRIKRVDFSTDTTWIKLFPFSSWSVATVKTDTSFGYSWVSKEGKLAIAELANDSNDVPKRFTWSQIAPLTASVSSINTTCGNCNGQVTVAASGLYTPYSYAWNNGTSSSTVTGLCAGNYSVTVNDNIGNEKIFSITITPSTGITLTTTTSDATCGSNNGSAIASASGGNTPYSYLWSDNQTTSQINGLGAGSFTVTVTDAQGCSATTTANVSSAGGPAITVMFTGVSCYGGNNGTATVTATGGTSPYTYAWSTTPVQNSQTASGLTAGSYSVTVNDNNNCPSVASVTVNEPPALIVTAISTNASSSTSSDGSATVNVTGGTSPYSYLWNNSQNSQTATGLLPGNYSVTVTDSNACTASISVTVNFSVGNSSPISSVEWNEKSQILLFPNPASNKIYFSWVYENTSIIIFDGTGKFVESLLMEGKNPILNVSDYKAGIYFFQLKNEEGIIAGKGKFVIFK